MELVFVPSHVFQIAKDSAGQMILKETGRAVEWTEEKNYMFKLTEFHQAIGEWIEKKQPLYPLIYNKIALIQLNDLKKIGDVSISREKKRLSWGIEVSCGDVRGRKTHLIRLVEGPQRSLSDHLCLDRCADQLSDGRRLSVGSDQLATELSNHRQRNSSFSRYLLASIAARPQSRSSRSTDRSWALAER